MSLSLKEKFKQLLLQESRKQWNNEIATLGTGFVAPFRATPQEVIDTVIQELSLTSADILYDLGCGEGHWCIAATKSSGCTSVGIELSEEIAARARISSNNQLQASQQSHLVTIHVRDMLANDGLVNIQDASVVIVYCGRDATKKLAPLLKRVLRSGTRVVSVHFAIPGWPTDAIYKHDKAKVYYYTHTTKEHKEGEQKASEVLVPADVSTKPLQSKENTGGEQKVSQLLVPGVVSTKPLQYLFLDIDGVLLPFGGSDDASNDTHNDTHNDTTNDTSNDTSNDTPNDPTNATAPPTYDPDAFPKSTLHALNHILAQVPHLHIVLSSTWRCGGGQQTILDQFAASTLHPLSTFMTTFVHTTDLNQHDHRQWEIASWLKNNTQGTNNDLRWVALDDEELLLGTDNEKHAALFQGHCVKTTSSLGLTWWDAKKAIAILTGNVGHDLGMPALPLVGLPLKTPLPPNTCRHWWKRGACRMGDDCRFQHPPRETLPIVPRKKYRQQVNNAGRFRQFREWVVATFDLETLQSKGKGHQVLCVADGKGILSFELYNVHDIPTTVIDPRPLTLVRNFKLWKRGLYHKKSYKKIIRYVPTRSIDERPMMPRHIRAFFLPAFWLNEKDEEMFRENLHKAEHTLWTRQGLQTGQEDVVLSEKVVAMHSVGEEVGVGESERKTSGMDTTVSKEEDDAVALPDTTVRDHSTAMNIVQQCTLVLGMHPDQAAGPIVEFAVAFNKSFAVVPCCVYS